MNENDKKYREYITEHIYNVSKVWDRVKYKIKRQSTIELFHALDMRMYHHDVSKWELEEFEGYRQFFYPEKDAIRDKESFDIAWFHHIQHNRHHWNYWVIVDDKGVRSVPMPEIYVIEMLCDWGAMSLKFGDTPRQFYDNNKSKFVLHEKTIEIIERWIDIF